MIKNSNHVTYLRIKVQTEEEMTSRAQNQIEGLKELKITAIAVKSEQIVDRSTNGDSELETRN